MGRGAFFYTAATTEIDIIALELAEFYGVDPEVMLRKPLPKLEWLAQRTQVLLYKRALERQRDQG